MFRPREVVIDTSCLLCLLHLDVTLHLDLLPKLVLQYSTVYIPRFVYKEVSRKSQEKRRLRRLLERYTFLEECFVTDEVDARLLYGHNLNKAPIGQGEAETIIQARERQVPEVLIDDRQGRKMAERYGLTVRGILGLFKEYKQTGLISEVKPLIEKLKKDKDFRLDEKLFKQVLKEIGED